MPPCLPVHCCYLLISERTKSSTATYIGYTNDPARRIRMHNREILGGARKTRFGIPWNMIVVVSGFPTHIEALQFEWAWQNPLRSKWAREAFEGTIPISRGFKNQLMILSRILSLPRWNFPDSPIQVHVVSDNIQQELLNCSHFPPLLRSHISVGPIVEHWMYREVSTIAMRMKEAIVEKDTERAQLLRFFLTGELRNGFTPPPNLIGSLRRDQIESPGSSSRAASCDNSDTDSTTASESESESSVEGGTVDEGINADLASLSTTYSKLEVAYSFHSVRLGLPPSILPKLPANSTWSNNKARRQERLEALLQGRSIPRKKRVPKHQGQRNSKKLKEKGVEKHKNEEKSAKKPSKKSKIASVPLPKDSPPSVSVSKTSTGVEIYDLLDSDTDPGPDSDVEFVEVTSSSNSSDRSNPSSAEKRNVSSSQIDVTKVLEESELLLKELNYFLSGQEAPAFVEESKNAEIEEINLDNSEDLDESHLCLCGICGLSEDTDADLGELVLYKHLPKKRDVPPLPFDSQATLDEDCSFSDPPGITHVSTPTRLNGHATPVPSLDEDGDAGFCGQSFHLVCLAQFAVLEQYDDWKVRPLLPNSELPFACPCSYCEKTLVWSDVLASIQTK